MKVVEILKFIERYIKKSQSVQRVKNILKFGILYATIDYVRVLL